MHLKDNYLDEYSIDLYRPAPKGAIKISEITPSLYR